MGKFSLYYFIFSLLFARLLYGAELEGNLDSHMICNPMHGANREASSCPGELPRKYSSGDRLRRGLKKMLTKPKFSFLKASLVNSSDLANPEALRALLGNRIEIDSDNIDLASKHVQSFFYRYIKKIKSKRRKSFEGIYAILGMISGTGVTWNAFANKVLVETLGWLESGSYSDYDKGTSAGQWTLMVALNIHTYLMLYPFNGGQMYADAGEIADCWNYGALPSVQHWSRWIVSPFAWGFYLFNTIPEMTIIVPRLLTQSNVSTIFGVPLAFAQRIGEQRRSTQNTMNSYMSWLARRASSPGVNKKREELVNTTMASRQRLRDLSDKELSSLYEVLFSRRKTVGDNDLITEHGALALLFGLGGVTRSSMVDPLYSQSPWRKVVQVVGGVVGAWGSVAAAMIIEEGIKSALEHLGSSPEDASVSAKCLTPILVIPRGISMINNCRNYFLRLYDSVTGHIHYKRSGVSNPNFSDVIYGKKEFSVLVVNYLEGIYWSLLYYALALPILKEKQYSNGEMALLITPSVLAQAAFEAIQQIDCLDITWHEMQIMRTRGWWKKLWDHLCFCIRGSSKCTRDEHFQGTSAKDLKKATRTLNILKVLEELRNLLGQMPPELVEQMHMLYIKANPLLDQKDIESSVEKEMVISPSHTVASISLPLTQTVVGKRRSSLMGSVTIVTDESKRPEAIELSWWRKGLRKLGLA